MQSAITPFVSANRVNDPLSVCRQKNGVCRLLIQSGQKKLFNTKGVLHLKHDQKDWYLTIRIYRAVLHIAPGV